MLERATLLKNRARVQRRAKWLIPVAGVGIVGVLMWVTHPEKNSPSVQVERASASPAVLSVVTPVPQLFPAPKAPEVPVQVSAAAPVRVTFGSVRFEVPAHVEVSWDGRKVDPLQTLAQEQVGPHRLRLRKPGSTPIEQTIEVLAQEPTVIRAF